MNDEIEDVDPDNLISGLSVKQTRAVLEDVLKERIRADEKFGWFRDYPDGEVTEDDAAEEDWARRVVDRNAKTGKVTWRDILTEEVAETFNALDERHRELELIQVACVAVAQVEAIRRRRDERRIATIPPRRTLKSILLGWLGVWR